jgi:hypothetical protein
VLGFLRVEKSPKLKDGVIGGENDDEEGEVFKPVKLEIG